MPDTIPTTLVIPVVLALTATIGVLWVWGKKGYAKAEANLREYLAYLEGERDGEA